MKRKLYLIISIFIITIIFNGCGSSIISASRNGNLTLVKNEYKKTTSYKDKQDALLTAIGYGHLQVVKFFVNNGVKIPRESLLRAAIYNHLDIVKYLVAQGVDVNGKNKWGDVALEASVERINSGMKQTKKDREIMIYLIEHGAKCSYINEKKFTKSFLRIPLVRLKRECLAYEQSYKQKLQNKQQEDKIQEHKQKKIEKQLQEQKTVEKYIAKNNLEALKRYTEENPNAVYYIKNKEIRLLLTGPKGMKIGDIKKLLQEGKSELIIVSLIKRVKEPYKEFTLDEIETLQSMGLSDKIISTMIDVTTKLLDNKEKRKQQEFLLQEQRKIANQKTKIIYKNNPNQKVDSAGNQIIDAVQDKLIDKGVDMLLDRLF